MFGLSCGEEAPPAHACAVKPGRVASKATVHKEPATLLVVACTCRALNDLLRRALDRRTNDIPRSHAPMAVVLHLTLLVPHARCRVRHSTVSRAHPRHARSVSSYARLFQSYRGGASAVCVRWGATRFAMPGCLSVDACRNFHSCFRLSRKARSGRLTLFCAGRALPAASILAGSTRSEPSTTLPVIMAQTAGVHAISVHS